ncbi:hypothetical protein PR048_026921 [Dryococelus australis]|uniref:CHK kinase-like domain-containing protein n=1 Tax=Dryococelus australis TaxID=614101 RepID=A0ABQ9GMN8_9NEOP|nr:hypothetical protein PR048_026921 [Dryococelus australis]
MATGSNMLSTQDVKELLQTILDAEGSGIEDISVKSLTKPGDNYGSTMLAVDVSLTPGPRTLHLAVKMLPKSAVLREMFQCEVTTQKETDLYLLVSPAYERIQRENNVPEDKYLDVFPKCYGAKTSSKGKDAPVDETAVILLENLKVQGFECGDRFTGLDLAHCKLVVDKMARFHATAVAIKIKKPEEFRTTAMQAATSVAVGPLSNSQVEKFKRIRECQLLQKRIDTAMAKGMENFNAITKEIREPFATLTHLDLWTNNIMFQYRPGSPKVNPTILKIIDFQVTGYDSPARDLLLFLYTSATLEVLSENYDQLVRLYHDSFVDCLQILGCDATPFSFNEFLKEIEYSSLVAFFHIVFMLIPATIVEEDIFSTEDVTSADLVVEPRVGEIYFRRASKLVCDFVSRKWI